MQRRTFPALILLPLLALSISGCTEIKTTSESEIIPYKTVKNHDASMLEGQTKVIQPGEQGLRTIVYKETYKWGNKVERKKVKTETVFKPSEEIVNVGTKKALLFTVKTAAGAFEINITAASRQPGYGAGRGKISDAAVLKGTIKNIGQKPARTGGPTDLALIDPALRGGVAFLTTGPATAVGPGQTISVTWAGSVNGGKPGKNAALATIAQMKVTARASVGSRNSIIGEVRTLDGFPSI